MFQWILKKTTSHIFLQTIFRIPLPKNIQQPENQEILNTFPCFKSFPTFISQLFITILQIIKTPEVV